MSSALRRYAMLLCIWLQGILQRSSQGCNQPFRIFYTPECCLSRQLTRFWNRDTWSAISTEYWERQWKKNKARRPLLHALWHHSLCSGVWGKSSGDSFGFADGYLIKTFLIPLQWNQQRKIQQLVSNRTKLISTSLSHYWCLLKIKYRHIQCWNIRFSASPSGTAICLNNPA